MEPRVRFCYLSELPRALRGLPFILLAPVKIVHQVLSIIYTFFIEISTPPEYIIVQVDISDPNENVNFVQYVPEPAKHPDARARMVCGLLARLQGHH